MKFGRVIGIFLAAMLAAGSAFATAPIRFDESVLPYEGGLLIPNYGTETLRSAGGNAKGYILYCKDGAMQDFIPADGNLKTPTAMAVYDEKLFICDADKLWVYSLRDLKVQPQQIVCAADDKAVNDMVLVDGALYVTVTNTNRIYKIDLTAGSYKAEKWLNVPSPNGIAVHEASMYVVSITPDYTNVGADNVVYIIKDMRRPRAEKFNGIARMYDGVAVSGDGKIVYVSDWDTASVIAIDTASKTESTLYRRDGMSPADICLDGGKLLIPDMVNHRVIVVDAATGAEKTVIE